MTTANGAVDAVTVLLAAHNWSVPTLDRPSDPAQPLFVYGLLKPGELAFPLIEGFIDRVEPAVAHGRLLLRDGLPLFEPQPDGKVYGHLVHFAAATRSEAWDEVISFEPASQYKWGVVDVTTQAGRPSTAYVLVGRSMEAGTSSEPLDKWSAQSDPVFVEGLEVVRLLVLEAAPGGVHVQPDTPELWHQFFRLQAAYLLLWSVIERYTALRYGPPIDPHRRVTMLGEDSDFVRAVVSSGSKPGVVIDTRDPTKKVRMSQDGTGASKYFYQVRSNLSHRGKSAFKDARLVFKCVVELHDIMRLMLADQLPGLKDAWLRQNSEWTMLPPRLMPG